MKTNNTTGNNSTGQTEGKKCNYSEWLQYCRVSKETADFLACILCLYDLNDKVFETVAKYFGDEQAEKKINDEYEQKSRELEDVIFNYVRGSIYDKVTFVNFDSI